MKINLYNLYIKEQKELELIRDHPENYRDLDQWEMNLLSQMGRIELIEELFNEGEDENY